MDHVTVSKVSKTGKALEASRPSAESQQQRPPSATSRYFSTTVRRLSKVSAMDTPKKEAEKDEEQNQNTNPEASSQPLAKTSSSLSTATVKTNRISVIKLPRKKDPSSVTIIQSPRATAASINNGGIELTELSPTTNPRQRTFTGPSSVIVTKVKRSSSSAK